MDAENIPSTVKLLRLNQRHARERWGALTSSEIAHLKALTCSHSFEVQSGDLQRIDGNWYVTHSGLLRLANRRGCAGIRVVPIYQFCSRTESHWAFRATVLTSEICKGFVGCGDANPANVSTLVRGSEMRIAETRAVNRALRKAYGIGLCSVEEIGTFSSTSDPAAAAKRIPQSANGKGHPLRDRLYVLVRQHQLDAGLVKLYAADFCGTRELRRVTREKMSEFIDHLSGEAIRDREALGRKLESYQKTAVGIA